MDIIIVSHVPRNVSAISFYVADQNPNQGILWILKTQGKAEGFEIHLDITG